mmetsp:Transcript_7142/g.9037  ORF Transcript_7142/g.9037 Transcript_7142/m.9037 type:complete len:218 (+) Transcript_7142:258-911(+)
MAFSTGSPLHFETGKYERKSVFLPDDEYGRALDTLVKACTDILLTNDKGEFLLGKRVVEPQPDWWYPCGGRMKPGETPYESASRLLKRELKLVVKDEDKRNKSEGGRFSGVGHYSYLWQFRNQEPKGNGTADISCVLTTKLSREEQDSMDATNEEYSEHKWMKPDDILAGDFHPALKQSIRDFLLADEWETILKAAKDDSVSDQTIANKVRQFALRC